MLALLRDQPAIVDRSITGREAWTRDDIGDGDYRIALSREAQSELLDAAKTLRRQPVPLLALRADSVDLPVCRAAMEKVRTVLTHGPRFALLQGLPLDQLTLDDAKSLDLTVDKASNAAAGTVRYSPTNSTPVIVEYRFVAASGAPCA